MKDGEYQKSQKHDEAKHIRSFLTIAHGGNDSLQTELFCQVCKQLRMNPSTESQLRGWQILAVLCSSLTPTQDFAPYLSNFAKGCPLGQDRIHSYSKYILQSIKASTLLGPRARAPSDMEIAGIMDQSPVIVRVYCFIRGFINLAVDSWTDTEEAMSILAEKLGIKNAFRFGLYEVKRSASGASSLEYDYSQVRRIGHRERLLETYSTWQEVYDRFAERKNDYHHEYRFTFVYKQRYFLDADREDPDSVEYLYREAHHDLLHERYSHPVQDEIALAALQLQIEQGDFNADLLRSSGGNVITKSDNATRFFSPSFLASHTMERVETTVVSAYTKLRGISPLDAKMHYITACSKWKTFGSTRFYVEPTDRRLPNPCLLCIG